MLARGENAGLDLAMELLCEQREKHPSVSFADLIQMGNAVALRLAGSPPIPMRYGRVDAVQLTGASTPSAPESGPQVALPELTGSLAAKFTQLRALGLSMPHSLALLGDFQNGFKNQGAVLVQDCAQLPSDCESQHIIFAKDELALTRDYVWAQSRRSEIGARFQPELGVQLD